MTSLIYHVTKGDCIKRRHRDAQAASAPARARARMRRQQRSVTGELLIRRRRRRNNANLRRPLVRNDERRVGGKEYWQMTVERHMRSFHFVMASRKRRMVRIARTGRVEIVVLPHSKFRNSHRWLMMRFTRMLNFVCTNQYECRVDARPIIRL